MSPTSKNDKNNNDDNENGFRSHDHLRFITISSIILRIIIIIGLLSSSS